MEIKILGTGCPNCKKLFNLTMEALIELGLDADLGKIEDIKEIISYKILGTPGLVINDKVKIYGKVPSMDDLKKLILEEKDK